MQEGSFVSKIVKSSPKKKVHGLYKQNALFLDYNLLEVLYKNTVQFKFSSIFRKSKFCTKKNHTGNDGSNNHGNGNGVHILLYSVVCFWAFITIWQGKLFQDFNDMGSRKWWEK